MCSRADNAVFTKLYWTKSLKSAYFLFCSRIACFSFSSFIAACLLSSGLFQCWVSNRGSSGMMPALVVPFFLTNKLKSFSDALFLLLSWAPRVPVESTWEIFITWSPLQRMSLKSVVISFSKSACHVCCPPPQLQTSALKISTEAKQIHLLSPTIR